MSATRRTAMCLTGIACGLISTAVALTPRDSASAQTATTPAVPFVSYQRPTGTELTSEQAANRMLDYARDSGVAGEVAVRIAHGTFATVRAVMNDMPVSAGQEQERMLASSDVPANFCFKGGGVECTDEEVARAKTTLLDEAQSGAYLGVLSATEAFRPAEKLRRGQAPVSGTTIALVIDSHTGVRESMEIGGKVEKPLDELGPVSSFVYSAESNSAQASKNSEPAPRGAVLGRVVTRGGHAAAGWRVTAGNVSAATSRTGTFSIRLHLGRYTVAAHRRDGVVCARKHVRVTPGSRVHLVLQCR